MRISMRFGRDRRDQKSWTGDGGVGLLVKKGIAEVKVVRVSEEFDMMWIELKRTGCRVVYCCCLHVPRRISQSKRQQGSSPRVGKADIMYFRRKGFVMCLGDFNSKIGTLESVVSRGERRFPYSRSSEDIHIP